MKNVLVGVSYKGTNYAGWQKQPNALAIQEVIENAIAELTGKKSEIFASGRTDAGVHALEQCFSFKTNFSQINKLPIALNCKLPNDIRILWAKEVDANFHARFSAHKKTYIYKVTHGQIESPFNYETSAYIQCFLNLNKMIEGANFIVGTHSFEAFCSAGATVPTFERTIYYLNITQKENEFTFEICGNGFLYKMVRIIIGTLIDVGTGKISPNEIEKIIQSKNRANAGKTMPAKGLFLKSVEY